MTDQEFAELLALGYERRGVEFKRGGPLSDKQILTRVARAALGMTNRRDGGYVIIGVDETQGQPTPVGLSEADLATWKYDDVADALAGYADPSLTFDLEVRGQEARKFVVLRIHEFEDIPVLCNKDFPDVLRKGACYVRSRRKPETSEIPSQEDMRDLLELATEKRLRRFIAQARAAGLEVPVPPSDRELFDRQRKDLA